MANVTLNVTDGKGQATGSVEAPAELFGHTADEVQAHVPLIHQVVVAQLAAARQARTPPRPAAWFPAAARSRGSRRHRSCPSGSIRAPQWYHGGTVFGPQPRDYSQRTPQEDEGRGPALRAFRSRQRRPRRRG